MGSVMITGRAGKQGGSNADLTTDLARRQAEGRPVRVGLIGAGEMGTDIVTQVSLMPGIEIAVLAETRTDHAWQALDVAGLSRDTARAADGKGAVEDAIRAGRMAITGDGTLACTADQVDVIIDATGNPGVGAELAMTAMRHGKHVVMMNVEADVTVGASLRRAAEEAGVLYSLGAGDEPSAAMELIRFAQSLGYPIIAAGKGKNNPLKFDAKPAEYVEEATRRNMNPRMLVEFVDGSKTMIEMAAIANATGLVPDRPGMHGPAATVPDLARTLIPIEDGGVLSRTGVVDYSVGKGVAPGVFVVVKAPHPRIHERMRDLKMGDGPYFTFMRPYHLTSLEVPLTAASLVLHHQPHMVPLERPVAEVGALAKEDLAPGVTLGKIGEDHYRGWITTVGAAREDRLLPVGLAERAVVTRAIKAGEYLTYDNCRPDETMEIVKLRRRQDDLLGTG
ncbi:putative homoserine dehydrogenase-like protein [Hyphomicrobiales bacterium]|nr:putative homoserine dehydrogenase-like protein [Hyphomicrobiales bacterium]CAH1666880.1 putative homoserine dehydrogenase-like protein [Hyphomicrobiales bacterium]